MSYSPVWYLCTHTPEHASQAVSIPQRCSTNPPTSRDRVALSQLSDRVEVHGVGEDGQGALRQLGRRRGQDGGPQRPIAHALDSRHVFL